MISYMVIKSILISKNEQNAKITNLETHSYKFINIKRKKKSINLKEFEASAGKEKS